MSWIIGLLTVILVLNCLLMILLILIQLPKKEAGMGTAFGGGATDALFGAGTGNALTNLTKYCTIAFFVLTLGLSILNARHNESKNSLLDQALQTLEEQELNNAIPPVAPPPADTNLTTPAPAGAPVTGVSTNPLSTIIPNFPSVPAVPAAPATPAPNPTTPEPDKN